MLLDPRWEKKPQVTEEPWRELLRRAADLIEKHGLAKYTTLCQDTGTMCVRGALMVADGYSRMPRPPVWSMDAGCTVLEADRALARYLGLSNEPCLNETTADWNNRSSRTQKEVVAALRAAAKA